MAAIAGGAVAGGLLGFLQSKDKNDQAQSANRLAATRTKYSPWTHFQAGPQQAMSNPWLGAAGGAMQGASMGQGLQSAYNQDQASSAMAASQLKGSDLRNTQLQQQIDGPPPPMTMMSTAPTPPPSTFYNQQNLVPQDQFAQNTWTRFGQMGQGYKA